MLRIGGKPCVSPRPSNKTLSFDLPLLRLSRAKSRSLQKGAKPSIWRPQQIYTGKIGIDSNGSGDAVGNKADKVPIA